MSFLSRLLRRKPHRYCVHCGKALVPRSVERLARYDRATGNLVCDRYHYRSCGALSTVGDLVVPDFGHDLVLDRIERGVPVVGSSGLPAPHTPDPGRLSS